MADTDMLGAGEGSAGAWSRPAAAPSTNLLDLFGGSAPASTPVSDPFAGLAGLTSLSAPMPTPVAAPAPTGIARAPATAAALDALVLLQAADGRFELTADLAARVGTTEERLRGALTAACGSCAALAGMAAGIARDRVWATAIVLATLASRFAAFASEWELLARRSRAYLATALGDGAAAEVEHVAAQAVALGAV